jgi:DNA-binding LacI/PurR family transcriptional regulator
LKYLIDRNVPFLSFGRPWGSSTEFANSYPWIDVDGASGTRDATKMFWKLGHRTIGFLGWKTTNPSPTKPNHISAKPIKSVLNVSWPPAVENECEVT